MIDQFLQEKIWTINLIKFIDPTYNKIILLLKILVIVKINKNFS